MSKLLDRALVEEQLLKLAPGVDSKVRDAYEGSEVGARRFSRLAHWNSQPRISIADTGLVTLRFLEIGVSMTTLIFIDHESIQYRASIGRKGVKYAPYCQGTDTQTNTLNVIKAFGVKLFTR